MTLSTPLPKLSHELLADAVQRYLQPKVLPPILPAGMSPEDFIASEYEQVREHMRLALENYRLDHAIADTVSLPALIEAAAQAAIAGDLKTVKKCLFPLRTVAAFTAPVALEDVMKEPGDGGV